MADDTIKDYEYPEIQLTDYVDESLAKIKARDDAAKNGFRRVSTFPAVTEKDIGLKVYLIGQGNFQLSSVDPDPQWRQLDFEGKTPATIEASKELFQPINSSLTAISKVDRNSLSNKILVFYGPDNAQSRAITGTALEFIALNSVESIREYLGLKGAALLETPIDGKYIKDGTLSEAKFSADNTLTWSTGDCKMTLKFEADDGWVMMDDGSIGSPGSGATTRANDDTRALFELLWDIPACEIQTYSGATSVRTTKETDWVSGKRITLPKVLGRALAGAGEGKNLTLRDLGSSTGTETVSLTVEELAAHNHTYGYSTWHGKSGTGPKPGWSDGDVSNGYATGTMSTTGEGKGHNNMQPTTFFNVMIKL